MRRLLNFFIETGLHDGVDPREIRYVKLTNALALIAISLSILNIPVVFAMSPAAVAAPFALVFFVNLPILAFVLWLNHRGWHLGARIYGNFFSLLHMAATAYLIGIGTRSHLFIILVIMAAFFQYPPWQNKYKYFTVAVAALVMVGLEVFFAQNTPVLPQSEDLIRSGRIAVLANLVVFIIAFMVYNQTVLRRAETGLEKEQARSEYLLRNILPGPIVDRLKESSDVIADQFPAATVLFADIVGFTGLSARLSPEALIKLLNELFSAFDLLVEKHQLEKIKTIGDAYMVAGGLPTERSDHLESVAELAREMIRTIDQLAAEKSMDLSLRIGIHTGPVAAGVIGLKKFTYDLWGDTVNTASRMEAHGLPGHIHVSATVQSALKHRFVFRERGQIEIKGKGLMTTFFLGERLP